MKRMCIGLMVILALAGCGSDNDVQRPVGKPAVPTLAWAPQASRSFVFIWSDVAAATELNGAVIEYQLMEDADGSSGYTQVASIAPPLTIYTLGNVPLTRRLNARYIIRACNLGGCADSAPVHVAGALSSAVGYFRAANPGEGDNFGGTMAMSGDGATLVVSAEFEDSNATGVNGNQASNSLENSGAAYVFVRNGAVWSQQAYLKASNPEAGDWFARAVAISRDGNTVAVGAIGEDSNGTGVNSNAQANNSLPVSGAAYVFTRSGTTWAQQAYVKASNSGTTDAFGSSVALSEDGSTLAVGAPGEASNATGVNGNQADNSKPESGAVYVYARSSGTWSQQAYVKAAATAAFEGFGGSVALSADGSTLAVGAFVLAAGSTPPGSGSAYVFARSGITWTQQAKVQPLAVENDDTFGFRVALSGDGNTLAVGAPTDDSSLAGTANTSGDDLAPGAGAAYVFTRGGASWSQQAYVKPSNPRFGGHFGSGVALSGDGNTLAVGAEYENGLGIGLNGSQTGRALQTGAAYVLNRTGRAWSQRIYAKAPRDTVRFGHSVALSAAGDVLAVGADFDGGSGDVAESISDSGTVFLY